MWHPTDSSVPSGIGFLVLSLVAQFTSAAPVADGAASVDQSRIFRRAVNGTATLSTDVVPAYTPTSSDVLSSTDILIVSTDTPTSSIGDATIVDTIISDTIISTGTPTSSDVLSSTDLIQSTSTDILTVSTDTPTSSIGDATIVDTTIGDTIISTGTPTSIDVLTSTDWIASTDTPTSSVGDTTIGDTTVSTGIETDTATSVTEQSLTATPIDVTTGSGTTETFPQSTTETSVPTSSAPVTAPPSGTTAAIAQATATASEYSSQIAIIIPIINAWTKDPVNLKTDTLDKVNNLINGIKGAIKDLGGSESSPCNGKKRGLGDLVSGIVSTVINTLSCAISELEDVTKNVTDGLVDGIAPIVASLTESNKDLEEESEEEEDEETKTDKTETETEDVSTTTEAETTTTTSGECQMRTTIDVAGESNNTPKMTIPFPEYTGVTTGSMTFTGIGAPSNTPGATSETSTGTNAASNTPGATSETSTGTGAPSNTPGATSETSTGTEASSDTSDAISENGTPTAGTPTAVTDATSEVPTTTEETETPAPTTTPSTLVTMTRSSSDESSNTITTGTPISSGLITTTPEATSTEPTRTYYPCLVYGGPSVPSAYCQCVTTVDGTQYVATTTLVDGQCAAYTEYPATINPVTDAPAPTDAPIMEPVTQTIAGTVLAWSSYSIQYGVVYTGIKVTQTIGLGEASTISTPVPTQTAVDNDGSGQCGTSDGLSKTGLGEACNRAIDEFEDDVIYTGYTTRYSRSKKGILIAASFGQAACIAKFSCDDYGIGMSGKLIKEA
ncbi:hypothetical protein G7Z17_g344 [Cylindrodendrum hubeiense]|uniref:Uncharacterized protein n=1 Tax=Cylindrodendrum hubeiense TaxID=595255 RepID=A0A9P5HLF5_9HYPO|nr:hypothetical protein G7Z17_g344 [Cylindrodendrum hubeiense]